MYQKRDIIYSFGLRAGARKKFIRVATQYEAPALRMFSNGEFIELRVSSVYDRISAFCATNQTKYQVSGRN